MCVCGACARMCVRGGRQFAESFSSAGPEDGLGSAGSECEYGRRGGDKIPGSREKLGRDGTTQEMLQEPHLLDQASEGEMSAREEG